MDTCARNCTDACKAQTEPVPAELAGTGNPTEKSRSSHSQMKKKSLKLRSSNAVSIFTLRLTYKVTRSQKQKDTELSHCCKNPLRRLPPLLYMSKAKTSHAFKHPGVLLLHLWEKAGVYIYAQGRTQIANAYRSGV